MTAAALVLDSLRREPATTDQLAAAIGCEPATVRSIVRRLNHRGYRFANEAGRHGGRGRRAVYRLVHDPAAPPRLCAWKGCPTRLSAFNDGRLCDHHRSHLRAIEEGRV